MGFRWISQQKLELQSIIVARNLKLLVRAIRCYAPECTSDFSYVTRIEVYDKDGHIFR